MKHFFCAQKFTWVLVFLSFGLFFGIQSNAQTISTFAGGIGDDSLASTYSILWGGSDINSLEIDTSGNIYIADKDMDRIRKINTSGIITTLMGNGRNDFALLPGTNANYTEVNAPLTIKFDKHGNYYFSTTGKIYKVNSLGIISVFAGSSGYIYGGYSGDGGLATSAGINNPYCIDIDRNGNVYLADNGNNRIRKIDTNGIISTVAGTGASGFSGDGGPAISAALNNPVAISFDTSGKLFIADRGNNRIRKVDLSTGELLLSLPQ